MAIFIDGLDGVVYFPLRFFGLLLLTESLISFIVASGHSGGKKILLYFKGGVFCFVSFMILLNLPSGHFLLAMVFSFVFFVTGLFMVISAGVIRFARWRTSFFTGMAQIAFAILMLCPGPTHYQATVSFFLGTMMFFSGIHTVRFALRVMRRRKKFSLFEFLVPEGTGFRINKCSGAESELAEATNADSSEPLVVHIWTPEGTANTSTIRRPVISRYIAAVDTEGVISTGHAALEVPGSIYISFYPSEDIDRSPSEFLKTLKATCDNDVPGRFQPDYATEATEWCHSDRKICFTRYNKKSLQSFWDSYRLTQTYNLTRRNCSGSVAYALESALDGVLSERGKNWLSVINMLTMPELWIATQIRKRAISMTWTPGLVMDYARALRCIVHSVSAPWYQRLFSRCHGKKKRELIIL